MTDNEIYFPNHIYKGVAWDFANLYTSYMEPPIEFFFMSFLTCLGNVLADRLTIDSEISPQPRLYTLLLGESADDRKSTAIKKTVELFKDWLTICWGVGSAEGLQKKLEEKNRLLLCIDEFQQFVGKATIQSSVLLPCVNTLFESNSYESHTKNCSLKLDNVYLSMLSASTKETYERIWNSSFTNIGFNNRLFLVPAKGVRKFPIPRSIPDEDKREISTKLGAIIGKVGNGLRMSISHEGLQIFNKWYHNLESSVHTKRLDTYAMRIMPLLAINEMKTVIDEDIIEKTIELMKWQLQVRKLYDPIDADNTMAKMEEKIRRVLKMKGNMTTRDLRISTNAYKTGVWYFNTATGNLQKSGEIELSKETHKWGPIEQGEVTFEVNDLHHCNTL